MYWLTAQDRTCATATEKEKKTWATQDKMVEVYYQNREPTSSCLDIL